MTAEANIDYEALAQGAMRAVVRTVLTRVAKSGLPGEHHFYIAFNTCAAGVNLSPRLKERYPEEMTVVLQHRFWDLTVTEDRFEVNLTFDSIPERLVIPFTAIKVFFDPSVPYGLQFEDANMGGGTGQMGRDVGEPSEPPEETPRAKPRAPSLVRPERKPRAPRKSATDKVVESAREEGEKRFSGKALAEKSQAEKSQEKLQTGSSAKIRDGEGSDAEPETPADAPAELGPKVVKLDAFRKK